MTQIHYKLSESQRIAFLTTAEETEGAYLELETTYAPTGKWAPFHYHPNQHEYFEVLAGEIAVKANREERRYRAGQKFEIPPKTMHAFCNQGGEEARVFWRIEPALSTQDFYETLIGLKIDGKVKKNGFPNLLHLAVLLKAYGDVFVPQKPPPAVLRPLVALLAPLGRLLGYRPRYLAYRAITQTTAAKA